MKVSCKLIFAFSILLVLNSCKDEPVNMTDKDPEELTCRNNPEEKYAPCVQPFDTTTLDIATWNLEFFPLKGATTGVVKEMIKSFNADIIGIQEIEVPAEIYTLIDDLEDWEVQIINTGSLSLGYLYNTCEITSVSDIKLVNIGDSYIFPRFPVELSITHKSGLEATLINIHLKCCDSSNGYQRRVDASEALKSYIDSTYPATNVVLLGDFNDEISTQNSPFSNFTGDTGNYRFTDMAIATGPDSDFSYPSWPSHIDHILVTDELFDNIVNTQVIHFEDCYAYYSNVVSDHRPVILNLSAE